MTRDTRSRSQDDDSSENQNHHSIELGEGQLLGSMEEPVNILSTSSEVHALEPAKLRYSSKAT